MILKNGLLVFILLALVGLMMTASLRAGTAAALASWQVGRSEIGQVATSKPDMRATNLQTPLNTDLVQRGKELYQAGQFKEAVTVWQQAAATFKGQGDVVNYPHCRIAVSVGFSNPRKDLRTSIAVL